MKIKRKSTILFPYKYFTGEEYPKNICEFIIKWFLGIITIILSPIVSIITIFTKEYMLWFEGIILNTLIVFAEIAGTFIFSDKFLHHQISVFKEPLWVWLMGMVTVIFVFIIVFVFTNSIILLKNYFKNLKNKKNCIICKIYKSWKEKYCEKIEII